MHTQGRVATVLYSMQPVESPLLLQRTQLTSEFRSQALHYIASRYLSRPARLAGQLIQSKHFYPTIYAATDVAPLAICTGNFFPDGNPPPDGERTYCNNATIKVRLSTASLLRAMRLIRMAYSTALSEVQTAHTTPLARMTFGAMCGRSPRSWSYKNGDRWLVKQSGTLGQSTK